jgi:hypothetical protein
VSSDELLEWAYARYLQATYIEVMSRKALDQTKKVIKLYDRTLFAVPLHGRPVFRIRIHFFRIQTGSRGRGWRSIQIRIQSGSRALMTKN